MKALIFFLLIGIAAARLLGRGFFRAAKTVSTREERDDETKANRKDKFPQIKSKMYRFRGGSSITASASNVTTSAQENQQHHHHHSMCHVVVSTSVGSTFLDKKKRLQIERNATIADLKQLVEKKFPGCPPTPLQKLFFGMRILNDNEIVSNLTTLSPVPILLDMLSGTSVYNKTMSITQALEAYVSSTVQQAYLGDKMRAIHAAIAAGESEVDGSPSQLLQTPTLDTAIYRDMFDSMNRTLYEKYADDIALALEEEKEPESESADTLAWRSGKKDVSPLTEALAKEFDLNWRGVKFFVYYSVLLAIFAYYGTTSSMSTQFLLLMVPLLWLSKLRQLRLVSKIAMYLVLPIIPKLDFLMPLLPAPYQAIAIESSKWSIEGDENETPILPQPKGRKASKEVAKAFSSFFGSDEDNEVAGGGEVGAKKSKSQSRMIQKEEEQEEDEEGDAQEEEKEEDKGEDSSDSDEEAQEEQYEQQDDEEEGPEEDSSEPEEEDVEDVSQEEETEDEAVEEDNGDDGQEEGDDAADEEKEEEEELEEEDDVEDVEEEGDDE